MVQIDNPLEYPDPTVIEYAEEPYINAQIITPSDYLGSIMTLCMKKRGVQIAMNYLDEKRVEVIYDMPLAEVLFDFYDKLKSVSRDTHLSTMNLKGLKQQILLNSIYL